MADILLGAMILGPLLLTYLLKSNAAWPFSHYAPVRY